VAVPLLATLAVLLAGVGVNVVPALLTVAALTVQLPGASPLTVPAPFCVRVPPGPERMNTGVLPAGRPLAAIAMLPPGSVYDTVAPAATADAVTVTLCVAGVGV
jgi:hypothetical protein